MSITWDITAKAIHAFLHIDGKIVGTARASYFLPEHKLTIVSWFVDSEFSNRGFGRKLFAALVILYMNNFGSIRSITYIWNGDNQYVMDWLVKWFDARCTCPIELLKITEKDIWEAHEFILNTGKVMDYVMEIDVPFEKV